MLNENVRITAITAASAVSVVLAAAVITTWWQKKKRENVTIPEKWRRVGELAQVSLYPLKSGAAMNVDEAECTNLGIQTTEKNGPKLRDRFFIVVTENGIMKTARQHPKMYLIKVSMSKDATVTFKAPGENDLTIPIPTGSPEKKNFFRMWDNEEMQAVDCGDEASKWLHSYLKLGEKEKVRMGYYQEDCIPRRDFDKKPWSVFRKHYQRLGRFDAGAFSDLTAYQLINEASVEDLNARMPAGQAPVSPSWFRPNLVVRGPAAFAEDNWNFIKIGDTAVFQNCKPSLRCILTTMNPETAVKDPDMQPLRTLRKYRLVTDPKLKHLEGPESPMMGRYIGLRQPGVVRVGDPIYIGE